MRLRMALLYRFFQKLKCGAALAIRPEVFEIVLHQIDGVQLALWPLTIRRASLGLHSGEYSRHCAAAASECA